MIGKKKSGQGRLFSPVRRETRVSLELGRLSDIIDFGWLRNACEDKFSAEGRPSIAPEVLGAIMFLGFWFNIDSDRELCEECEDRLSFREFIGIADDEQVPVHSSLTHWRQRLGRDVFQQFIAHSIEVAVKAGMTVGRCRMFDSTLVKAQADAHSPARLDLDPILDANDYLDRLGEWEDDVVSPEPVEERCADKKETGKRRQSKASNRKHGGRRTKSNKKKLLSGKSIAVNTHDLDAKLISRPGRTSAFYHKAHFEFDSASGLVMNADAGHYWEALKMMEFISGETHALDTVVADTGYFDCESQLWLAQRGICSHISVRDNSNNSGRVFGIDAFAYNADRDEYICPNGKRVSRQGTSAAGEKRYATGRGSCTDCEFADYCFSGKRKSDRRQLTLCVGRELIEAARQRNACNRYTRLKIKRSIICEGSIGTMKNYGGLRKARWVGEEAMVIQAMMAGAVHNLKKVLKFIGTGPNASMSTCFASVHVVEARLMGLWQRFWLQTDLLPAAA